MKRGIVFALTLMVAVPAMAADWTAWLPVSDETVSLWLTREYGRVFVGPTARWDDDDLDPDVGTRYGLGLVAGYDLLEESATLKVGSFQVPVQWSVGVEAGITYIPDCDDDLDPASQLFTMLRFGEDKAGIMVLYEYDVTEDLWSPDTIPEQHTLSVGPYLRF